MERKVYFILAIVVIIVVAAYFSFTPLTPPDNKEACESLGGKWGIFTLGPREPECNLPTSDGGKECTDVSQCESSHCLAPEGTEIDASVVGTCYGFRLGPGCWQDIRNGIAGPEICT